MENVQQTKENANWELKTEINRIKSKRNQDMEPGSVKGRVKLKMETNYNPQKNHEKNRNFTKHVQDESLNFVPYVMYNAPWFHRKQKGTKQK